MGWFRDAVLLIIIIVVHRWRNRNIEPSQRAFESALNLAQIDVVERASRTAFSLARVSL